MHQTYDRSSNPEVEVAEQEPEFGMGLVLPPSAVEELIEISKRRAELLGSMKSALLMGDFDNVKRIAAVLCGLTDEHE
jgi:hypothetical protein